MGAESSVQAAETSKKDIFSFGVALGLIFTLIWMLLGLALEFFFRKKGLQYSFYTMVNIYFLADFIIGLNAFFKYDKISEGIVFCLGTSPFLGIISGLSYFDFWTGVSVFVGFNIAFSFIFILTTIAVLIIRALRDLVHRLIIAIGGQSDMM